MYLHAVASLSAGRLVLLANPDVVFEPRDLRVPAALERSRDRRPFPMNAIYVIGVRPPPLGLLQRIADHHNASDWAKCIERQVFTATKVCGLQGLSRNARNDNKLTTASWDAFLFALPNRAPGHPHLQPMHNGFPLLNHTMNWVGAENIALLGLQRAMNKPRAARACTMIRAYNVHCSKAKMHAGALTSRAVEVELWEALNLSRRRMPFRRHPRFCQAQGRVTCPGLGPFVGPIPAMVNANGRLWPLEAAPEAHLLASIVLKYQRLSIFATPSDKMGSPLQEAIVRISARY